MADWRGTARAAYHPGQGAVKLLPVFTGAPGLNRVYHMDAFELLHYIPDGSIDAVITDPPYGINLDQWDKPINIDRFVQECYRVLKPAGFLFFTAQMPVMLDWLIALKSSDFIYREHISWVKRIHTGIALPLHRSHESIFIYARAKAAKYFKTKGSYADVKLAGVLNMTISIEGIDRYIKDLQIKARNGEPTRVRRKNGNRNAVYDYMDLSSDRSPEYVNFTNVWSFLPERQSNKGDWIDHPTQKPIRLMERAIELLTQDDSTVLDPFAGSGTTLIAARNLGRNFIGCDLEYKYVEIARRRLAQPYTLNMFERALSSVSIR